MPVLDLCDDIAQGLVAQGIHALRAPRPAESLGVKPPDGEICRGSSAAGWAPGSRALSSARLRSGLAAVVNSRSISACMAPTAPALRSPPSGMAVGLTAGEPASSGGRTTFSLRRNTL